MCLAGLLAGWLDSSGNAVDEERCVAAGFDNGDIKLFDLRAMKLRWEHTLPNGVSARGRGESEKEERRVKGEKGKERGRGGLREKKKGGGRERSTHLQPPPPLSTGDFDRCAAFSLIGRTLR